MSEIEKIYRLEGLAFVKALLAFEQRRFDESFLLGSAYEDINRQFGIFPPEKQYPKYFVGDITRPEGKHVFVGINPGYEKERNKSEQAWIEERGLFEGSCHLFEYLKTQRRGLAPFHANIAGFIRRLHGIEEKMDWDWFQEHFISLEIIPYHSNNTNGLNVNDPARYRRETFEALLKILRYLQPKGPIFITGFPSFERLFSSGIFADVMAFERSSLIWDGTLDGRHFIGLPFLNRPRGGKDALVNAIGHI